MYLSDITLKREQNFYPSSRGRRIGFAPDSIDKLNGVKFVQDIDNKLVKQVLNDSYQPSVLQKGRGCFNLLDLTPVSESKFMYYERLGMVCRFSSPCELVELRLFLSVKSKVL